MRVESMREELISEYPGELWRKRVMSMPNYQVMKVYTSIQERKEKKAKKIPWAEQMSFLTKKGKCLYK